MKRKETKRMKTFKKAFKTFKEEKSLFKRLLFIEV
jgi:hypothetical protein